MIEFLRTIIKSFIDEKILRKPGYVLKGSCKKCGSCCRNITFMIEDNYITREEEFERIKKFDPTHNHFYISGRDEDGTLLFTCKSLTADNLCKNYQIRSLYCRFYPKIMNKHIKSNAEMLEGCGYYIESSIKFEEFMK